MVNQKGPASFSLEGREIGHGSPCFIIAEAGVNHNGREDLALALIDAAADAGADAVKFQTFQPDLLATAEAPKAEYQERSGPEGQSQREMLESLVLPLDCYQRLRSHAHSRNIVFLSSPFDEQSADFLRELGVCVFKAGSGELTNHPFLRHLAITKLPLIVSTGMSDLAEVSGAVRAIREVSDCPLALLHCVSSYPTTPSQSNLRAMATLRAEFGVPVGWSDHTPRSEVAIAAAALGASIIEKHITLDCEMPGPDHRASLEPKPFSEMVRGIRIAESALGTGEKKPVPEEHQVARVARKSLFLKVAVARDQTLASEHVIALRPGTGLSPSELTRLLGRRFRDAVSAGAPLREADLYPESDA